MGVTSNGLPFPENSDFVADGAMAIKDLAENVDAKAGLWLVKKQTIGTAVADVEVLNAFSTKYDAYKIVITGGVMSATANIQFQLGPSTVSGYNAGYYYANQGLTWAGVASNVNAANVATIAYAGVGTTSDISLGIEVINPALAKFTHFSSNRIFSSATGDANQMFAVHRQSTAYTAFKIFPLGAGPTFTGGTIAVYGYNL